MAVITNIDFVSQLENHTPFDSREEDSLNKTISLYQQYGNDSFSRDFSQHHLTASAFVLSKSGLLLHYHKKFQMWIQPGGHIDQGEVPFEAALRETKEETGIDLELENKIYHIDVHDARDHMHYDIRYLGWSNSLFLCPGDGESKQLAWFSLNLLSDIGDEANKGIFSLLNK